MKHSVLFDARLVLKKPTGIGRYITEMLPELLLQAPYIHVHLLRRPDPWSGYNLEDWQMPNLTHHTSSIPHMDPRQQLFLPLLANRLNVDLLHYPHFDAPVLFGSIPVISTMYDAKFLVRPDFFTEFSDIKRKYMRFCFAQTLRKAAGIITISNSSAADLRRLFRFNEDRLHVIYPAVASEFQPASSDDGIGIREKYGLVRPFVLSVSEIRPHKNHAGLIKAFANCQSRHSYDLVIIGQRFKNYTEPEEVAQQLDVDDRVHFLTDVGTDDLVRFYVAADLFVLVSFYEGFGLPILEAMACNTPVIASCTTATGEITGTGGIQVDPTDTKQIATAIDRFLTNYDLRQQQIVNGQTWLEKFSWQKTAEQTIEVYHRVFRKG